MLYKVYRVYRVDGVNSDPFLLHPVEATRQKAL